MAFSCDQAYHTDCLLQEGIIQLFLVTIFATSAIAKYEYNFNDVHAILSTLNPDDVIRTMAFSNLDKEVEWHAVRTNTDVYFQVKDEQKSSGYLCGGGPAIAFYNRPWLCLFEIIFRADVKDGKDIARLGLLFRDIYNNFEITLVAAQVFTVPDNEASSRAGAQFIEPINNDHISEVLLGKSFRTGQSAWLKTMLHDRMCVLEKEQEKQLAGNVIHTVQTVLYSPPVVMKKSTLENILNLPYLMTRPMERGHNVGHVGTSYGR